MSAPAPIQTAVFSPEISRRRTVQRRRLWRFLQWTLFIISLIYCIFHVGQDEQVHNLIARCHGLLSTPKNILLFSASILLLCVNWGFEAYKWQKLVIKFQRLSFFSCFKAILAGTAVSMWFPNRAGEYLGRMHLLKPDKRLKGILATLIGSISQLLITLILGTAGLLYYAASAMTPGILWNGLLLLGIIFTGALLFFYFSINRIRHLLPRQGPLRYLRRYLLIYSLYSGRELQEVLGWSAARYMVFCTQFYLLLMFFGISLPIVPAFATIFFMYFVQTLLPTTFFTELFVRGLTTSLLFQPFGVPEVEVMAASGLIWLINLVIPGTAGAFVLLTTKRAAIE